LHVFSSIDPRPPRSPLFPYTTLFRSQLHQEVNRFAACLQALGVVRGDRVLIYMPMVPEAVFAMLACVRIGAIHSVVFGGFASVRSEEHTSELQSRGHLVCRLLLEKKN